ncbi:beta-glucosidase 24-like [Prunus dulcis]|uniref:beta-glucosidase 24-like n=1 Tax=Prunus dulcis TaxID=3755 RepID=UPI001481D7C7|nr:beta-glucosidase 24-like [Prunus dulcis]
MEMQLESLLLGLVLVIGFSLQSSEAATDPPVVCDFLNRSSFETGFVFGAASASYQYEGAAFEDGRGPSIWDNFTHQYPEKIADGTNGDVAINQYHRYKEDLAIANNIGLDAYRFSISWSRLLPNGTLSGGVNQAGIEYYNKLINETIRQGLKPFATIFHWDLPQALEEEFGGLLSRQIVHYFRDYADLCFREFGDRVKYWITLNEPYTVSNMGYAIGTFAPGRCSNWQQLNCTGGNSAREPYLVTHHLLLSHAAAVQVYRNKYQASQKGVIGITLVSHWFKPVSEAPHHRNAATRALDFMFGWFMEPITSGHYPHSMRHLVGDRLPPFKEEESKLLAGSFDFLGLNYYTTYYASYAGHNNSVKPSYVTDPRVNQSPELNGVLIGPQAGSSWLYVYPKGIHDLLVYVKKKYNDPIIYITENGVDELDDPNLSLVEALNDTDRIDYYHRHICYVQAAIKDGVKVKGFFAWSLLDNFEWASGYTVRFGLNYVDFKDGLKRYEKRSAQWFKNLLKK